MTEPILLLITGLPCTGKTTLGRRIAQEFHWPLVSRDAIKEQLFDSLGWQDRAWSQKLGHASYAILHHLADVLLHAHCSCILESNFTPAFDSEPFQQLQARHQFFPLQIVCHTDGPVLFERFQHRSESGERHPGHVDYLNYQEFAPRLLDGRAEPLEIGGEVLNVDTTVFEQIEYAALFREIREKMGRRVCRTQ